MNFKAMKVKLIVTIIVLFVLFQIFELFKVRIISTDLPKGKIVFSSDIDDDNEIYTMNINGTDLRQLTRNIATKTNTAADDEPSFSTDGKKIVFVSRRQGEEDSKLIYNKLGKPIGEEFSGGTFDIYIMDSDGKNQIPLTYSTISSNPFFSPDSEKIVFNLLQEDNHVLTKMIDINTRKEKILNFGGGEVEFSPDAKKTFDNFENGISVMNADGTNRKKLIYPLNLPEINDNKPGVAFDISSEAGKIAFVIIERKNNHFGRVFKFYIMSMDNLVLEKIYELEVFKKPGFIFTFKYSPDERSIIFNASLNGRGIYLLNLKEKNLANITEGKENWKDIFDFTFTPDGEKIVFVADIYPKNYYFHAAIIHNLKAHINYYLFRKHTPFYDNKYICIMDIDGKNYRRIAKLPVGTSLGHDFIHWE